MGGGRERESGMRANQLADLKQEILLGFFQDALSSSS